MACAVIDVLKICGRNRALTLRMLLQQSAQAAELQCHPHVNRCSRCWMSHQCPSAVGQTRLHPSNPFEFPLARGLQTLSSVLQRTCKKYDHNGTECCTDECVAFISFPIQA